MHHIAVFHVPFLLVWRGAQSSCWSLSPTEKWHTFALATGFEQLDLLSQADWACSFFPMPFLFKGNMLVPHPLQQ